MTYSARALVLLASSLVCGCFGRQAVRTQDSAECPRVPEANAVRTDSVPLERLTGRFRIVQIDTVRSGEPRDSFFVDLRLLDSATIATLVRDDARARVYLPSTPPLHIIPLVGSRPGIRQPWRGDQRGLSEGSCWPKRCADEAPTNYRFEYVGARSIRGVWTLSDWGIASGFDPKTGLRLSLPAGIFCMTPT